MLFLVFSREQEVVVVSMLMYTPNIMCLLVLDLFLWVIVVVICYIFRMKPCRIMVRTISLFIIMWWRLVGDFTHILSIFLILFLTIFYLCICSLFLGISLFLLAVLFGKTFVFWIVVCQFEFVLFRWLVERLSVEFLY